MEQYTEALHVVEFLPFTRRRKMGTASHIWKVNGHDKTWTSGVHDTEKFPEPLLMAAYIPTDETCARPVPQV